MHLLAFRSISPRGKNVGGGGRSLFPVSLSGEGAVRKVRVDQILLGFAQEGPF